MGLSVRSRRIGFPVPAAWVLFAVTLLMGPAHAEVPRLTLAADGQATQARQVKPAFIVEQEGPLSIDQAMDAIASGSLESPSGSVISRGIGSEPVWLVFDVSNPAAEPITRRVTVEIGWLESVVFHQLSGGEVVRRGTAGDGLAVHARDGNGQWPRVSMRFPPGESRVLVRVETADPMLVPLYMESATMAAGSDRATWLIYGFVYGAVFALLAYNFVLFLSLGHRRYLFYTLYLLSFLAMNLSYTGLGMVFFWPDAVDWQQWAPVLFMVAFGVSGLAFGTRFLAVSRHQPRLFRFIVGLCGFFCLAVPLMMALGWQSRASLLAFSFIPLFALSMLYMGVSALTRQRRAAVLFVLATVASVIGAVVSSLTVWGWVPYTRLGFHAVEFGMVVDAILLALALAEQVRFNQRAREDAEKAARIDPLTGLNNRRGFEAIAPSHWAISERQLRPLCVMMVDIDDFKKINDHYGHPLGDELLCRLARLFRASGREGDVVARWGGEEFIFLLPDTDLRGACVVAERVRASGEALSVDAGDKRVSVTLSIGIAERTAAIATFDDLIAEADRQLYRAKSEGRNRIRVSPSPEPAG